MLPCAKCPPVENNGHRQETRICLSNSWNKKKSPNFMKVYQSTKPNTASSSDEAVFHLDEE